MFIIGIATSVIKVPVQCINGITLLPIAGWLQLIIVAAAEYNVCAPQFNAVHYIYVYCCSSTMAAY